MEQKMMLIGGRRNRACSSSRSATTSSVLLLWVVVLHVLIVQQFVVGLTPALTTTITTTTTRGTPLAREIHRNRFPIATTSTSSSRGGLHSSYRSTKTCLSAESSSSSSATTSNNNNNNQNDDKVEEIWFPQLRRLIGSIATVGALETSYLTYVKIQQQLSDGDGSGSILCGVTGDCNSVLNGPYATLPYTDIPLAAVGLVAYLSVIGLAVGPLLFQENNDTNNNNNNNDNDSMIMMNRQLLTGITTLMGSFSICLMILLYGILHQSCPYCVLSAGCSTLLASITLIGNCWPNNNNNDTTAAELESNGNDSSGLSLVTATGGSILAATAIAVLIYVSGSSGSTTMSSSSSSTAATDLMATMAIAPSATPSPNKEGNAPPPITTDSSSRAIAITKDLVSLNAKMYGAYWCSHCYDQKIELGKQAFTNGNIPYIECSKDGFNTQSKLCKSKELPGYPTWEINGEFFPGQQELDELEQIIQEQKTLLEYDKK